MKMDEKLLFVCMFGREEKLKIISPLFFQFSFFFPSFFHVMALFNNKTWKKWKTVSFSKSKKMEAAKEITMLRMTMRKLCLFSHFQIKKKIPITEQSCFEAISLPPWNLGGKITLMKLKENVFSCKTFH